MISAWMTTPSVVPTPSNRMCGSVMVPGWSDGRTPGSSQ